MSALTLEGLRTRRNYWQCDVELYRTGEEAKEDGFSLMYEDKEGTVYGIRSKERLHCWDQIAFVPYPEYYSKYERRAIG